MKTLNSSGEWIDLPDPPPLGREQAPGQVRAESLPRGIRRLRLFIVSAAFMTLLCIGVVLIYLNWPAPFTVTVHEPSSLVGQSAFGGKIGMHDATQWESIQDITLLDVDGAFYLVARGTSPDGSLEEGPLTGRLTDEVVARINKDGKVRVKLTKGTSVTLPIEHSRLFLEQRGKP